MLKYCRFELLPANELVADEVVLIKKEEFSKLFSSNIERLFYYLILINPNLTHLFFDQSFDFHHG